MDEILGKSEWRRRRRRDGKQKKFKGFAFVDFTTAKAAKKAMKLHDTLFRGRPVTVERCERKAYQSRNR